MSGADLTNAAWWAWLWSEIEHWAFLGVVVALAIEFAALRLAAPHKKILEDAKDAEMSRLAVQASGNAAMAADATNRANRARKEAAEAQLALVKFRTPRRLSVEQKNVVAEAAKAFGNMKLVLMVANDDEPLNLGIDIADVLKSAGWEWLPYPGVGIGPGEKPLVGVSVLHHIEIHVFDPALKEPATALAEALKAVELEDVRLVIEAATQGQPNVNAKAVYVIVGNKK